MLANKKLRNDPSPWYCTLCTNEMLFSKMSNNDQKNILHKTKPTSSSKNLSIREMMKHFCHINQFFDDNKNAVSCV